MPRRVEEGLSAAKVKTAGPGRHADGGNLYLLVTAPDLKFWIFRFWSPGAGRTEAQTKRKGRLREMGLGPACGRFAVPLAEARAKARELRDVIRDGRDPLDEKHARRAARFESAAKAISFREASEAYIAAHESAWRNPKHRQQWANTLAQYAYPVIGSLHVASVDTALVLKVLEPLWKTKTETAKRLRARIENVLAWATTRGHRSGDNPARWAGHLENLLPAPGKVAKVRHHPALPYAEIGPFMERLRSTEGQAARALEFLILTAARTSEVLGARRREIDLAEKVWVVPAERMKGGKEHRVPLSKRAIELLAGQDDASPDAFLFPGAKRNKPLSSMALLMLLRRMDRSDLTAHGFRSTFRDWAAERTSYPSEVAEMALAHRVSDRVEAAYRRGDLFLKRLRLAEEWARYCATVLKPDEGKGKVRAIRAVS